MITADLTTMPNRVLHRMRDTIIRALTMPGDGRPGFELRKELKQVELELGRRKFKGDRARVLEDFTLKLHKVSSGVLQTRRHELYTILETLDEGEGDLAGVLRIEQALVEEKILARSMAGHPTGGQRYPEPLAEVDPTIRARANRFWLARRPRIVSSPEQVDPSE